jgi:hypothetical protein
MARTEEQQNAVDVQQSLVGEIRSTLLAQAGYGQQMGRLEGVSRAINELQRALDGASYHGVNGAGEMRLMDDELSIWKGKISRFKTSVESDQTRAMYEAAKKLANLEAQFKTWACDPISDEEAGE